MFRVHVADVSRLLRGMGVEHLARGAHLEKGVSQPSHDRLRPERRNVHAAFAVRARARACD